MTSETAAAKHEQDCSPKSHLRTRKAFSKNMINDLRHIQTHDVKSQMCLLTTSRLVVLFLPYMSPPSWGLECVLRTTTASHLSVLNDIPGEGFHKWIYRHKLVPQDLQTEFVESGSVICQLFHDGSVSEIVKFAFNDQKSMLLGLHSVMDPQLLVTLYHIYPSDETTFDHAGENATRCSVNTERLTIIQECLIQDEGRCAHSLVPYSRDRNRDRILRSWWSK